MDPRPPTPTPITVGPITGAPSGKTVSSEFVKEVIRAVADVLRLLDYYLGHEWSKEHMTRDFATELGLCDGTDSEE